MAGLLVTFDDSEHLAKEYTERLCQGTAFVPAVDAAVGEPCEVVLVHPDSGETLELSARVDSVDDRGATLAFAMTPLVENQLRKFAGRGVKYSSVHERIRDLSGPQRRRLALTGDLTERSALERVYGKEIWEHLLQNPKLTVGEVARMARKGTMTGPLLETIVSNGGWVRAPQVRRALLSNPRLDTSQIRRVLRHTPGPELKLVPVQTAYPIAVRSAAKKLLGKR